MRARRVRSHLHRVLRSIRRRIPVERPTVNPAVTCPSAHSEAYRQLRPRADLLQSVPRQTVSDLYICAPLCLCGKPTGGCSARSTRAAGGAVRAQRPGGRGAGHGRRRHQASGDPPGRAGSPPPWSTATASVCWRAAAAELNGTGMHGDGRRVIARRPSGGRHGVADAEMGPPHPQSTLSQVGYREQ